MCVLISITIYSKKKKKKKKPILALELYISFYKRKYTSRKWWPLIETAILCQLTLRKGSLNHSDRTWSICHNVLAYTAKQHPANHITLFSFNQTSHNELIMHIIHVLYTHTHTLLSKFNILKNYMDNKRLIEFYIWSTGIGIKLIILSRMWSSIWRNLIIIFQNTFLLNFMLMSDMQLDVWWELS